MPSRVEVVSIDQMPLWDSFVQEHPFGSIYHTSAWREVVQRTYSIEPFYFGLRDGNGQIEAGLPLFEIRSFLIRNRISTVPCAQSCDPLVSNEEQYLELKEKILSFAAERSINAWELKTTNSFPFENRAARVSAGEYFTFVLDIGKPLDVIFSHFHKGLVQRSIKKAQRFGLSLKRGDSLEDVHSFYELYLQMRKQKGLLPQPEKFFMNLWRVMHESRRMDILFAEYRGMLISGVMLLKYGERATYEYGATQPGFHRYSPSPFLLWEAIQQAKAEGYRYFDFGRTASSEEGLASFKQRWGASPQPFVYYEMINRHGSSSLRQNRAMKALMNYSMRLTPLSLCNYAGRLFYKHLL